ncbi:MAG: signal peptide peptidase SppA [Planctomycetes bacterium]|nr:signal peptide peptidase SppA [Planctomycetota bacterium]
MRIPFPLHLSLLPFAALLLFCHAPLVAQGDTKSADEAAATTGPKKQQIPFLRPQGSYADLPEMGFSPMSLLGGGGSLPKPFFRFVEAVDGLAKVDGAQVVFDLSGGASFNGPQLRELERALARVREAGKQITCYLENADSGTFELAAQCDRVLMADMGALDLRSPAMSVMHMKDALDLLGIQVEVTRVGAFKGAVEPYMLPTMSDHLRAHYEAMLRSINDDVVRRIASGRRLSAATVRELQAQRLFTAKEALGKGLVDQLVPWSGAERAIALLRGDEQFELTDAGPKKKRQSRDLMAILGSLLRQNKEEEIEDPQLVVMHLSGQIVDGDKPVPGNMVSGPAVTKLDELAANDLVKGVVVRINSPGGSATASEAIRTALQRLAAKKPVVFSMGELAASGGYWITTIGQPILAEVSTITGSIGVFGMRFQPGALMRRLGVHTEIVRLDDGPLMDATDRPWSDTARERMQGFVDEVYARFLQNVAASRHKTTDEVDAIAGGRVWSGQQAVDNGLVDAIGGLDDAIARVRAAASLGDDVEVLHVPEPKNFADSLFASMFEAQVQAGGDAAVLRAVLAECARYGEVLGVVRDALVQDGMPRVYAMLPAGLRVR